MKKNRNAGMKIKNCKTRGEWAEAVFAEPAIREGLPLAKAWGESFGYDFMVEQNNGRVVRVQVKSTIFPEGEGYSCTLKNSPGPYKKNSLDFVAAYVIPEDVWYIIPEKKVRGIWSVALYPELKKSKYGEYQEAWHLLHGPLPGLIARIEAVADEDFSGRYKADLPLRIIKCERASPGSGSPLYPCTLIRENERTARDEIGRPMLIAGRKVVKISIRFTCGRRA